MQEKWAYASRKLEVKKVVYTVDDLIRTLQEIKKMASALELEAYLDAVYFSVEDNDDMIITIEVALSENDEDSPKKETNLKNPQDTFPVLHP